MPAAFCLALAIGRWPERQAELEASSRQFLAFNYDIVRRRRSGGYEARKQQLGRARKLSSCPSPGSSFIHHS